MFSRLERAGATYVDNLDRYYEAQGHYPATLADLGVQLPETAFGLFEYEVQRNGQSYVLHIGQYSRDMFEMWWDRECRCWRSDT